MNLYSKLITRPKIFQKVTGLTPLQFQELLHKITPNWRRKLAKKKKSGRPCKVKNLSNQLLCLLFYYRTYTTQYFLGFWFRVNETTICRTIKRLEPILKQIMTLKKKQEISELELETILVDCTEQPIQRPSRNQKKYFSGKKKNHTIKTEIQMNKKGRIIKVSTSEPGSKHDYAIFKENTPTSSSRTILADSGYQGIQKQFPRAKIR